MPYGDNGYGYNNGGYSSGYNTGYNNGFYNNYSSTSLTNNFSNYNEINVDPFDPNIRDRMETLMKFRMVQASGRGINKAVGWTTENVFNHRVNLGNNQFNNIFKTVDERLFKLEEKYVPKGATLLTDKSKNIFDKTRGFGNEAKSFTDDLLNIGKDIVPEKSFIGKTASKASSAASWVANESWAGKSVKWVDSKVGTGLAKKVIDKTEKLTGKILSEEHKFGRAAAKVSNTASKAYNWVANESIAGKSVKWVDNKVGTGLGKRIWNKTGSRFVSGARFIGLYEVAGDIRDGEYAQAAEDYKEYVVADRLMNYSVQGVKFGYNWIGDKTWRTLSPKIANLDDVISNAGRVSDDVINVASEATGSTVNVVTKASEATSTATNVTAKTAAATAEATEIAANAGNVVANSADDVVNVASKVSGLSKFAGAAKIIGARVLTPLAAVLQGYGAYKDYDNAATKEEKDKALVSGVTSTTITTVAAGGVVAASLLATNFWNPVGWVAGAYLLADGAVALYRDDGKGLSTLIGESVAGIDSNSVVDAKSSNNKNIKPATPALEKAITPENISKHHDYVVSEDVRALQEIINKKLSPKDIAEIAKNGKNIKEDGKLGPETVKAALRAGLGNSIAKIGIDVASLEKMANENDHKGFKAINSFEGYSKLVKEPSREASVAMSYYENGSIDRFKMSLNEDKKRFNVNDIKYNSSESTAVKKPFVALLNEHRPQPEKVI